MEESSTAEYLQLSFAKDLLGILSAVLKLDPLPTQSALRMSLNSYILNLSRNPVFLCNAIFFLSLTNVTPNYTLNFH